LNNIRIVFQSFFEDRVIMPRPPQLHMYVG
jgi:hypothetical protein